MLRVPTVCAALTAACLFALGCGRPAADPAVVAEYRGRLELAEEPDGAQTVLEVRQVMYGEDSEATPDHANHDHDGDGVQDHAPEDHVDAEHEHAEGDHADHDHAADAGDDAEEPGATEGEPAATAPEADHDHAEHDSAAHDHADHEPADEVKHDHAEHDHADHDHAEHDLGHGNATAKKSDADKKPVIDQLDVVMVGSVGGVPNPSDQAHPEFPFSDGKAMFFLADPEAVAEMEEHEHKHAPGEECAFCLAHAGDSAHLIAVIQFADKDGKPLNVDARDLFELKEKETVVVKGKAKIAPGGMLTVDATGLYVRR